MATAKQVKEFIEKIAPIIQKYAKKYGYKVCSPIIAQACLESAYGTSSLAYKYHNYFGLKCGSYWKGKSVNLQTKEEYTAGTLTTIRDNFRAYDSMDAGVKGYFEFISTTRYKNLKTATTPKQYLELIKADGYATSSTYVNNNMSLVSNYNLTKYDKEEKESGTKDNSDTTTATTKYYKKYTGRSMEIDKVFKAVGVPAKYYGNYTKRKAVAKKNNISNYVGSYEQNIKLINLAKNGKLKKV